MRILAFLSLLWPFPLLSVAAEAVSVPVELAYRNAAGTAAERHTVVLQGPRDRSSLFASVCGSGGGSCECLFYRDENDEHPLRSFRLSLSDRFNSLSCWIPGGFQVPDSVKLAAVRLRSGGMATDKAAVKTELGLADVLGSGLTEEGVRGIYRYSCSRTFFEGEGVGENELSCVPHQHLGLIRADYHFYTFRSRFGSLPPGGDSAFGSPICGRNDFLKIQCTGSAPELRYGLYKDQAEPFLVRVQLTRAPEGEDLRPVYGFAALPDEAGNCPVGLVKARPWKARPASMGQQGPSCPAFGCPSNFVNPTGSLNPFVLEVEPPASFQVSRWRNATPCSANGDCASATFAEERVAQSVRYRPLEPVLCVIPRELVKGPF